MPNLDSLNDSLSYLTLKEDTAKRPLVMDIPEELIDQLEECHLSDEHVEMMVRAESALNQRASEVPASLRIAANVFLWRMTMSTKAPSMRFFESAQLFDTRSQGKGLFSEPHHIMTRAAAAWLMTYKFSEVHSDPLNFMFNNPLRLLATTATKASACLGGLEVTKEAILEEERKILVESADTLGLANVLTWLEVSMGRLDIVTRGTAKAGLKQAMEWCEKMATTCVCYGTPASKDTPRSWALGVLVLSLAASGLLPADIVAPPGACQQSVAAAANGRQPPSAQQTNMMVAALEFAAAKPMDEIRQAAWSVLEVERQWQPIIAQLQQRAE